MNPSRLEETVILIQEALDQAWRSFYSPISRAAKSVSYQGVYKNHHNSLAGRVFVLRHCFENAIRRGLAWFLWRINCFLSLFTALINIHLADACVLLQCSALPSRAARDIDELWVWGCSNHTAIRPHHGFCGQIGARSTLRYISPPSFLTGRDFPPQAISQG